MDSLSLPFILLTTFLIPICLLISWYSINFFVKEYVICFLLLEGFLINIFATLDLFLFYIFFESVLIPIFIIIGIWGTRDRKIHASFLLFLYTLLGSLVFLLGLILITYQTGTSNLLVLWYAKFSANRQLILWLSFFISFSIKIPMLPFHSWLPEAHSEAPSAGSVLLAGVLLKLGGYGFLRFSLTLFPEASIYFSPLILNLSLLAIIYASLITLRQVDLKKIIAYSSISHMGFVTLGIFSFNHHGLLGSIYVMVSHGLVSSSFFLLIGLLYDRFKTRILKYFTGLTIPMPLFSSIFLYISFSSIAFPGTSSFISELLVLLGVLQFNFFVTFLASFSIIFGGGYSIWVLNRLCFGSFKLHYLIIYQDLSRREFWLLVPICIGICVVGICPKILSFSYSAVLVLLDNFLIIKI